MTYGLYGRSGTDGAAEPSETFTSFVVGGQRLYGMLHLPAGTDAPESRFLPAPGVPGVVLLHGFTGNRSEDHRLFVQLSRHLAALGVASLRFDFRGSGDSQGDFSEMTVGREVEDALAAVEHLRAYPGLDPLRVSLLGFSLGGMVAALSAPQARPHRLALVAPALPETLLRRLPGGQLPATVQDRGGWPVGRAFYAELPRLDPLKAARQWGGEARVFHGDADEVVPPENGVRYAGALNCEALGFPGAGHVFGTLEQTESLIHEVTRFLMGQ